MTSRSQGAFAFSEPCRNCRGTGSVVDDPCPTCGGSGVTTQTRTITVRIPAGVKDGQRIRLAGKGAPGRRGGPAGDLFVVVHVAEHELFGRKGDDLTLTVPITFAEAALGTTLTVPTLDGTVSLKVPAGTASGRTLRVRGRGVPGKGSAGDLLVTLEVAVPVRLDRGAAQGHREPGRGDGRGPAAARSRPPCRPEVTDEHRPPQAPPRGCRGRRRSSSSPWPPSSPACTRRPCGSTTGWGW